MNIAGIALVIAVLGGAALQRVAGMGFAMVVAPFALVILPGQQGVVLANVLGAVTATGLIWPARKSVDWQRVILLSGTSVIGAVLGFFLIRSLDAASFKVVVGIALVVAIVLSLLVGRTAWVAPPGPASVVAGTGTGMLVTMSGIGGPPMTVYSVLTRWEHRAFAASMQPYVVVSSAIGAAAALLAAPGSFPAFAPATWLAIAAALVVGLVGGRHLDRIVSPAAGRVIVIVLGLAGGVMAIISGMQASAG